MKTIQTLVLVLVCLLLYACGAVIDPSRLKRSDPAISAELPNGYVYVSPPAGVYDNQFKYELAAGTYVAELEDERGTFFRGPLGCVGNSVAASTWKGQPLNQVARSEGGVYVPRSASESAKMYFYRGGIASPSLPAQTTTEIVQRAAPSATIGQSAVGGAIAGSLINAMIESERGKIGFMPGPKDGSLRAAMTINRR